MNILIASPVNPFNQISGEQIRIFQFIKYLSINHSVSLIFLESIKHKKLFKEKFSNHNYCKDIWRINHPNNKITSLIKWLFSKKHYRGAKFFNKRFGEIIKKEISSKKYDVIIFNSSESLQYTKYDSKINNLIYILDQHNVDELWYKSFINSKNIFYQIFGYINLFKSREFNKMLYKNLDLCLSVSDKDNDFSKNLIHNSTKIITIPNGVDLNYFSTKKSYSSHNFIIFCGSMDVAMNIDAVLRFTKFIFPKIKSSIPETKFLIVGKNPSIGIRKLNDNECIFVTGTVKDVRPYYEMSKVSVAPFTIGGGTKLKILEAMAMKIPIVSTAKGTQGIDVINNKHIFIENNYSKFSEKVIECLNVKPITLVNNAYTLVKKKYSWNGIFKQVENEIIKSKKNSINI